MQRRKTSKWVRAQRIVRKLNRRQRDIALEMLLIGGWPVSRTVLVARTF